MPFEQLDDHRLTPAIIPRNESQGRCEITALHGLQQQIIFEKAITTSQQWIIHDEGSQLPGAVPAALSENLAEEQHERHEPGEPVEEAHPGGENFINVH